MREHFWRRSEDRGFPSLECSPLRRHGITEIELGVGLSKIAKEDSYEASFLETYEESFTADVRLVTLVLSCIFFFCFYFFRLLLFFNT